MTAPLSDIVTLNITQNSVGFQQAGFGVPMILGYYAAFSDRIRYYGQLLDVAADFPVTTMPEYLAAQAMFSQSPAPSQIAIGRGANKPTQVYVISVAAVRNNYAYAVNVKGKGVTPLAAVFTSGGSNTNDLTATGLVTALNAAVGKNFTAATTGSAGSLVVTITGTAAGDWFSLENVNSADLLISQTGADPGVAADLTAIALVDGGWYALDTLYNSDAYVKAAAAWAETQKRIYLADVCDSVEITAAQSGTAGTADYLAASAYTRTSAWFHQDPSAMEAAGVLGKCLPYDPGSETWFAKTIAGLTPLNLSATNRVNLRAKKCNWVEKTNGVGITWDGKTSDGGFIDTRRALDWLESDMGTRIAVLIAANPKIPYTDAGAAMLETEVRASLTAAAGRGILVAESIVVTVPKVSTVSTTNKGNRIFPNLNFSATLQGAIQKVLINGAVSV